MLSLPSIWNWQHKPFQEKSDKWLNLSTGRFLQKPPAKNPEIAYSLRGVRILGTEDQISLFWKENSSELAKKFPNATFEQLCFKPFEDIAYLAEEAEHRTQLCLHSNDPSEYCIHQSFDVAQLSPTELEGLDVFNFGGCFLKAKVVEVIDGDTLKVAVNVNLKDLAQTRTLPNKRVANIYSNHLDSTFCTILVLRTLGYDAVEKDQPDGQLAKQLFTEKLLSLNNLIFVQIVDTSLYKDKYGRNLAILYEDFSKKRMLNSYLYEQGCKLGKKLVNPYMGGTKASFD